MSVPVWVNPVIKADTDIVTGSDWNNYLYTVLLYLYSPPSCKYARYSSLGIPNTTWTTANLGGGATQLWDNASFGTAGNPLTIPVAGVYRVTWGLEFAANATGNLRAGRINVNNGALFLARNEHPPAGGTNTTYVMGTTSYQFNAGDQIVLEANQDSGSTLNISPDSSSTNPDGGSLEITWQGFGS